MQVLGGDNLMSSVSSLGSSQYTYNSPLQQLEAELQSEVSAGTVSSSDESALSSALTSINNSLTADQSSSGSQAAGSTGDSGPGDIKSKINNLIQAQVSSGALTSDQATELQNLFSNTFGNGPGGSGGQGGPGGPGGPQGFGGPPPGPPPSGGSSSASALEQLLDSSSSTDASSTDGSSSDSNSLSNVLQDFLKQLQDSQSLSYGANGATTASSSLSSTLLNYQA
jgi:hypothetical protein